MTDGVPHPAWFVVGGVLLVVAVVVAVVRARAAVRAEELASLPVPDRASPCLRAESSDSSLRHDRAGSRRDGQLDREAAQERAARDVLRCAGGRVDVAPVRCPVDGGADADVRTSFRGGVEP